MRLRSREYGLRGAAVGCAVATVLLVAMTAAEGQQAAAARVGLPPESQTTRSRWPRINRDVAFDNKYPVPTPADLHVLEDGVEQPGVSLHKDDEPVSICLMLDVSSSMQESGGAVIDASRRIIASLLPQDEMEVISFSYPTYIEQEFTTDRARMDAALTRLKFQGGSAFYDGLAASIDLLNRPFPRVRPVIVILSDGDDNASHLSFQALSRIVIGPDAPTIYSLSPPGPSEKGRDVLSSLAKSTNGVALEPAKLSLFSDSAAAIAQDIHSRYRIEYTSTHTQRDGKLHKVEIRTQSTTGASKPKVIFRQEYYAPSL